MEVRCPRCDLVIQDAAKPSSVRNLVCPHCGDSFGPERFREMNDADFDPKHIPKGISLEVTDQQWCLVASLRSLVEAIACLCIPAVLAAGIGWSLSNANDLSPREAGFAFFIFVMIGLGVWQGAQHFWGTIIITIDGKRGTISTGVGNIRSLQRFDWSTITRIEDRKCQGRNYYFAIVLHGLTETRFGRWLSDERRHYVLRALRRLKQTQQQAMAPDARSR